MYQNYNGILNPLEQHFQKQEVFNRTSNTLAYIATFAIGAVIGIAIYRWMTSGNDQENDFEFHNKTK